MTLRKYALIYAQYLRHGFAAATSYRLHFVLVVVMDWVFYASALLMVDFLYDQVSRIGAWPREQFLFFVAFMLAVDQLHMTFVAENFWNFSEDLRSGRLDLVLVKPVHAMFPSFFGYVRAPSLVNLPLPWIALVYFGQKAGLAPLSWALLPPLVLLALTLQVSLEILIAMAMFLTVESFGINFLRMQLQQLSRWPDFVFRGAARLVFTTVLPVLLIGSPPVRFLFTPVSPWPLAGVVVAILGLWAAISGAWRLGLRYYESASS